ncbi:hypothetical protein T439DRAFT_320183 [Meredithblackwellia eburnea MCA 4105]
MFKTSSNSSLKLQRFDTIAPPAFSMTPSSPSSAPHTSLPARRPSSASSSLSSKFRRSSLSTSSSPKIPEEQEESTTFIDWSAHDVTLDQCRVLRVHSIAVSDSSSATSISTTTSSSSFYRMRSAIRCKIERLRR